MSKLIEGRIECPFYIKEGDCFIRCEGCIGGTECIHRFTDNKEKARYENEVCSVFGGKRCEHHRNVAVQYDRGLRS